MHRLYYFISLYNYKEDFFMSYIIQIVCYHTTQHISKHRELYNIAYIYIAMLLKMAEVVL